MKDVGTVGDRLSRHFDAGPGDPPPLRMVEARLRRRRRHHARTGVAALMVGVAGLVAVVGTTSSLPSPAVTGAASPSPPDQTSVPEAIQMEGHLPVSGSDGSIVGFVSNRAQQEVLDKGEPVIQLGQSTVAFRGLEVVDSQNRLVGYFLSGNNGFVSLEQVNDPVKLAKVEAIWRDDQEARTDPPSKERLEARKRADEPYSE